MHNKENWDHLRFVLAVARLGSVSAAAQQLGVNHATVLRKVAAFEARHGIEFFKKSVRGYQVIPEFHRVLEAIIDAESALFGVSRAVSGVQAPLMGQVRVTSTDTFCTTILPGIVTDLSTQSPDLHLSLISNNAHLDLSRLDADISVRPAKSLPDDLIGTIAATLDFAAYRSREIDPMRWLGLSGPLARSAPSQWMRETVPERDIAASSDSFLTLARMAGMGLGRVMLPCVIAQGSRDLQLCDDQPAPISVPVWVAAHRDYGNVARVMGVREQLAAAIAARASELLCEGKVLAD